MAEFTDQDRALLDTLRKALERDGKTRTSLDPWQERLGRDGSVAAERSVLAAKMVEGFAGSWAAQYHFGYGGNAQAGTVPNTEPLLEPDPQGPPVSIRAKTNHTGARGMPEINFAPYNWRTNTFGSKGPSLVGHPISFEVVGPTLKSPVTDWTWQVEQGAGPNGGDLLTPDVRPDGGVSPVVGDIAAMYGPGISNAWAIGDAAEPNGGIYLVVSDDGANAGALAAGQTAMAALPNFVDTARYEIFRVSEVLESSIEIHPNKSFSTFFDLPAAGTRHIRGITIIRPYVTRLVAIPQSGAAGGSSGNSTSGREQTFVVVSPARAAGNDNYPPYSGPGGVGAADGSWLGGGFSEARAPGSSATTGSPDRYGGAVRLPIPAPVLETVGDVEQSAAPLPTPLIGDWFVELPTASFTSGLFSPTNLPIVRVSTTTRRDDLAPLLFGSIDSCLGWFDVVDVEAVPAGVVLARVPETDPVTGLTYWGPGPYVSSVGGTAVSVGMTLHLAVENLWTSPVFNIDRVEASRLKNLIDPGWVGRFEKQISDPALAGGQSPPPPGSGAGRPDRAIFSTDTTPVVGDIPQAANPGSLMDLGFRMVLFPAREDPNDATQAIPDFDHPIYGREVVIDGSVSEKQYIDIDYAAGIVRLSHPPPTSNAGFPDASSDVIPNGIQGVGGNNPRGEVVLFAACVPYSMEDSQVGTGARVTVHHGDGRDRDVASDQFEATIDQSNTTFSAVAPFFGASAIAPNPVEIVLDRLWEGPETGVISINQGSNDTPPFGRWLYSSTRTVMTGAPSRPVTALGGLSSHPSATDPTPASTANPRSIIGRREANPFEQSVDLPALTDFYVTDTTYGSSLRTNVLRFKNHVASYNLDGSLTLESRSPGFVWNEQGSWAASGILDLVSGDDRLDTQGVLAGVYYQNEGDFNAASSGVTSSTAGGQRTRFLSGPGLNDFDGVVTRSSLIRLSHYFRLVIKFQLESDGAPNFNGFVGLVGPGNALVPPPVSLVDRATISPTNNANDYLGLRFNGPTASAASFYAQRVGLIGSAISRSSGATIEDLGAEAHYLVIESTPYFDLGNAPVTPFFGTFPAFVKIALFDQNFREVGRTRFYDQDAVPRGDLELVVGTQNLDGAGNRAVHLYHAKLVNFINLPFRYIP